MMIITMIILKNTPKSLTSIDSKIILNSSIKILLNKKKFFVTLKHSKFFDVHLTGKFCWHYH